MSGPCATRGCEGQETERLRSKYCIDCIVRMDEESKNDCMCVESVVGNVCPHKKKPINSTKWREAAFPWELTDDEMGNLVVELDQIVRDPPMVAAKDSLEMSPCGGCGQLNKDPHKTGCAVAKIHGVLNHYRVLRRDGVI